MPELGLVYITTVLTAAAVSAVVYRAARGRSAFDRLALASLPFTVGVLAWHGFVAVGPIPYGGPWSAARLLPSFALRSGYALYEPAGRGPVLGWIYPPGAPLAYLPATFLGGPQAAIYGGRVLTLLYYYAPAAWLLLSVPSRAVSRLWRGVLLAGFALLTSQSQALSYCSTEVHADATALGLAAVALGLLGRSRGAGDRRARWGAVLLATLAVWSKQLTAPVLVVLPVWVLAREGVRPALRFTAAWLVAVVGVAAVALAWLDPSALVFNILTVPSRHPWRVSNPLGIGWAVLNVQRDHLVLFLLLAAGLADRFGTAAVAPDDDRPPDAWPLFLVTGLVEAPLAVLGLIKVGGYDNNLSFSLYFLALGAFLLLARSLPDRDGAGRPGRGWAAPVLLGSNVLLALVGSQRIALDLFNPVPPGRDARAAVRYLKAHPGQAYFPWQPLEHLLVDGRAYHFEYGVYDRDLAGYPVGRDQFFRHVPPRARYVIYPQGITVCDRIVMTLAGGLWRPVELRELPGWLCYERSDGGPLVPPSAATPRP